MLHCACIWSTKQITAPGEYDLTCPPQACSSSCPIPSVSGTNTHRTPPSLSSAPYPNQWPSSQDSAAFFTSPRSTLTAVTSPCSTLTAVTSPHGPLGLPPGLLQPSPSLPVPTKLYSSPRFVSIQILSSSWLILPAQKGFRDSPVSPE